MRRTLAGLESVYKQMAPGFVFSYNFQDKEYERLYRGETQIGILVRWFAALAVIISCLGLLGLTAYSVERKRKEIGIRKVLGASEGGVVYLVMRQFIFLVGVAFVLAVLPGWYFMNDWLQQYAYRTKIDWTVFAIAGIMALMIAVSTISALALRAARSNPVKSLRSE
jgi:putative ABC transport system permease protein